MSLTICKDVPSLTIFSNSMLIFLNGQLQILASARIAGDADKLVSNKEPRAYAIKECQQELFPTVNSFSHVGLQCQ